MKLNKEKCKVLHLVTMSKGPSRRPRMHVAGEQRCWKGTGGIGGQQAKHESAEHCCSNRYNVLGCNLRGMTSRERCDYPPLLSSCQAVPVVLCSVLVPALPKRYGQVGEALKKDWRGWKSSGKTVGVKSLLHGEGSESHHSIPVLKYLKMATKDEVLSSPGSTWRKHRAMGKVALGEVSV